MLVFGKFSNLRFVDSLTLSYPWAAEFAGILTAPNPEKGLRRLAESHAFRGTGGRETV